MKEPNKHVVRTSETTIAVINTIRSLEKPRIKDVAAHLDISPSTALRHLNTLEKHGYVVKTGGTYRLSSIFLDIAGELRNKKMGLQLAESYVDKLVSETNERAQFMTREGGHRVILFRRTRESTIRAKSRLGKKGPLHDTAGGKAILASLTDDEVERFVEKYGLSAQTEHTIVDYDELFAEIESIREQGFAISHQEATIGYNAVGATVLDSDRGLLGALSVSGPRNRMKGDRLHEELPELLMGMIEELELKIEFSDSQDAANDRIPSGK
jgi:DNA-binding IclR family transcriptional regulator